MKKIISLVAVFAIIASCSLCAFADTTITVPADVTDLTETAVDGVYTVPASSTGDYATIVAVKGTTIQVGAIQYINQASTAEGTPSFEFSLNPDLLAAATTAGITDTKVYVVTGGDGEMNVAGYIETAEDDEPDTFVVSGSVVATIGATLPVVKLTAADSTEYVATVTLNADDSKGQTVDYTVTVPAGDYTFEITKAAHITYTSPLTVSDVKAIETITMYSGDTDNSGGINISDFTAVGKNFGSSVDKNGASFVKAADTDDSDGINISDFTAVGKNFGKTATKDYTAIK